jgi:hypothetical protein
MAQVRNSGSSGCDGVNMRLSTESAFEVRTGACSLAGGDEDVVMLKGTQHVSV